MLRRSIAAATLTLFLIAGVATAAGPGDGVWVNGVRHHLSTGPATATSTYPSPLYVISPVNARKPLHPLADAKTHGFGAHDHVFAPSHGARTCELELVVPGRKAKVGQNVWVRMTTTPAGVKPLAYAARIGSRVQPFTWAARIRQATTLGLVRIVDTKIVIACSVT